jgi:hypothetical protein
MSANGGINITKYMLGNTTKTPNAKIPTVKPIGNTGTAAIGAGERSSIARILAYLLAIVVVILVILLFINFFITPIFKLKPGGPGIIPVPGFDDGVLFWNTTNAGMIKNKDLPIAAQSFGYTINLDVFIQNPLQFSTAPRVFFSRGATTKAKPSGDTMLSVLENYNIAAALLPDTTDLIVSVLNTSNNMENVIISNINVQEPFRLTMVVMEQALEVYINGNLMKTRMFSAVPKNVNGDIYPSTGTEINVVKVRNLKIWSRILSIGEIQQATPALSSASNFGANAIPSSSTCGIPSTNTTTSKTQKVLDRYNKLSVDSVSDDYKLL